MNVELTAEERATLARDVMRLLDAWSLEAAQQVELLGLGANFKTRTLTRFRQGMALPQGEETTVRAYHLLSIGRALDTSFPHNPEMANHWVKTPSRMFSNRSPLEVMLGRGVEGIARIHEHLARTNPWG